MQTGWPARALSRLNGFVFMIPGVLQLWLWFLVLVGGVLPLLLLLLVDADEGFDDLLDDVREFIFWNLLAVCGDEGEQQACESEDERYEACLLWDGILQCPHEAFRLAVETDFECAELCCFLFHKLCFFGVLNVIVSFTVWTWQVTLLQLIRESWCARLTNGK